MNSKKKTEELKELNDKIRRATSSYREYDKKINGMTYDELLKTAETVHATHRDLLEEVHEKVKNINGEEDEKMKPDFFDESEEFIKREDFTSNDINKVLKLKPYDLLVKSVYEGIKLDNIVYRVSKFEEKLFISILKLPKFRNIRIDEKVVSLLIHTDNVIHERKLFYPAIFIDSDFVLYDRFVVKGILVFECFIIRQNGKVSEIKLAENGNEVKVHFLIVDKKMKDITVFGFNMRDLSKGINPENYILPSYSDERDVLHGIVKNVGSIVCNLIDMIEGNSSELETRIIMPAFGQNEKREKKGKSPITTTVVIKPKKELLRYAEAFEKEHRAVGYSHRFIVRGHWRHFGAERYVNVQGEKIWIKPFVKGKGILIRKDVLFTDKDKEDEIVENKKGGGEMSS